jgi:hypothetical protein
MRGGMIEKHGTREVPCYVCLKKEHLSENGPDGIWHELGGMEGDCTSVLEI